MIRKHKTQSISGRVDRNLVYLVTVCRDPLPPVCTSITPLQPLTQPQPRGITCISPDMSAGATLMAVTAEPDGKQAQSSRII